MQIIDLTHTFENGMPAYPGEEPPRLEKIYTYDKDGFQVIRLTTLTHSGTHLDMPSHFYHESATVDKENLSRFAGKGILIDCRGYGKRSNIPLQHIALYENELNLAAFAIIWTGWDQYWGTPGYFADFPVLEKEALQYLAGLNLKGLGFDCASVDPVDSSDFPNHQIILRKNMVMIENLTNLEKLNDQEFIFAAFPLKIKDGDGSPVRAVGIISSGMLSL